MSAARKESQGSPREDQFDCRSHHQYGGRLRDEDLPRVSLPIALVALLAAVLFALVVAIAGSK